MDLSFANPAGFWALLGLPAVVAIHFLQRKSRLLVVTTLFLLEQMRRESETGSRFERLRSSLPLWLQLLIVLLLTWLLVGPRWLRKDSVQRVAVVFDASASMQAFQEKAVTQLTAQLGTLSRVAAATEYTLLSSEPEMPALYHGTDRQAVLDATAKWSPVLGSHDFAPALRMARSLVGDGLVIFLTDHRVVSALPFDAKTLAVGEPKDNCGFAGLTIEDTDGSMGFQVLVKNHSRRNDSRRWWIEAAGQRTDAGTIELAPGQAQLLRARFPDAFDACMLVLEGDTLAVDDRLPLVRPRPKSLSVFVQAAGAEKRSEIDSVLSAFPNLISAATPESGDLVVAIYDPLAPALPIANACVFSADPQPGATYAAGVLLAESDPLMEGLNWQGLLVRDTLGIPRANDDRTLLWQGERPLIVLRSREGRQQLLCNFDLHSSNARRLPAFAVLLHRFLEMLRREKIAPESANFETSQPLRVAHRTGKDAPPLTVVIDSSPDATSSTNPRSEIRNPQSHLRAPREAGFFGVKQGEVMLLQAAAHFADPRESDLSEAASINDLDDTAPALIERHSEADSKWRLWALLALAALLASWWFARERGVEMKEVPA
ncbi:MAG: BatA domain-containing protein [Verrucomicrobiales bacterium]